MRVVPAGVFKQTCLRLLDEVAQTGEGIEVTKHGRPVARVVPVPRQAARDWGDCMRGTARIEGDLVAPASEAAEWEVLGS
jgi:prevent-host-death family protein